MEGHVPAVAEGPWRRAWAVMVSGFLAVIVGGIVSYYAIAMVAFGSTFDAVGLPAAVAAGTVIVAAHGAFLYRSGRWLFGLACLATVPLGTVLAVGVQAFTQSGF